MKLKFLFIGMIVLMFSCSTKSREDKTSDEAEEKTEVSSTNSVVYDPSEAIWQHNYNSQTEEFVLEQVRQVDNDTLTGQKIEKIINRSWPKVQVEFLKTSDDTAYIAIPDSEVLTQQMGTAGAESFMMSTTYSFTELKGIKYVSFDFEEGDHAIPGVYSRNSWKRNGN
jgi:hypothetical protein